MNEAETTLKEGMTRKGGHNEDPKSQVPERPLAPGSLRQTQSIEEPRYIYRHVQFNHVIRTPGQLLAEHGDSPWELVRIVPYDGLESILVLRSTK